METFICYLAEAIDKVPTELSAFSPAKIDDGTITVDIHRGQTLNELYAVLSQAHIQVTSMRNKVNRLEEIFLRLVTNR